MHISNNFKGFCETNLKLNCVWISYKLWALYVFPLGCDMWLPGDYLVRYYSLCDLGILAPVFVMVISFGFVSAMSSGFVSMDQFRLCVGDEFRHWVGKSVLSCVDNEFWLCVGRSVLALCPQWVSALCRRLSCGLRLDFLVWNGVVITHSV